MFPSWERPAPDPEPEPEPQPTVGPAPHPQHVPTADPSTSSLSTSHTPHAESGSDDIEMLDVTGPPRLGTAQKQKQPEQPAGDRSTSVPDSEWEPSDSGRAGSPIEVESPPEVSDVGRAGSKRDHLESPPPTQAPAKRPRQTAKPATAVFGLDLSDHTFVDGTEIDAGLVPAADALVSLAAALVDFP
jgi:hypothetical protein